MSDRWGLFGRPRICWSPLEPSGGQAGAGPGSPHLFHNRPQQQPERRSRPHLPLGFTCPSASPVCAMPPPLPDPETQSGAEQHAREPCSSSWCHGREGPRLGRSHSEHLRGVRVLPQSTECGERAGTCVRSVGPTLAMRGDQAAWSRNCKAPLSLVGPGAVVPQGQFLSGDMSLGCHAKE